MRTSPPSVALAAFSLALASCGTRGDLYVHPLKPLAPVAAADALVAVVPQTARAVLLRPGSTPKAVAISPSARVVGVAPAGDLVAIVGGPPMAPAVDLLNPRDETVQTLALHGVWDAVAFSPSGRLAVLTYAAASRVEGLAARNLNELDVLDLGAQKVTRLQLDTDSLAPRSVVFAAAEASSTQQLVAVLFDKGVAVFDALQPTRSPRRISIRPAGSASDNAVLKALFSPDARYLYVQAQGMDDVVVVELGADSSGELTASLNFVAGGTGLSDIDVPRGANQQGNVLAIYRTSREAVMLDARGIEDNAVRLPLSDALTRIRALPDGKVLAFDGSLRRVVAWEPATGKDGEVVLDAGFDATLFDEVHRKAVFRHPTLGARNGGSALSVVSVEDDVNRLRARVHSIQLAAYADALLLDGERGRVFFANSTGEFFLARLDLGTLQLSQVVLDARAMGLAYLSAQDSVVALHPDRSDGDLTFVSAAAPERATCERVTGYALTADADRPSMENRP